MLSKQSVVQGQLFMKIRYLQPKPPGKEISWLKKGLEIANPEATAASSVHESWYGATEGDQSGGNGRLSAVKNPRRIAAGGRWSTGPGKRERVTSTSVLRASSDC